MNNLFIVVSAVSVYNFQLAAASPATGEKTIGHVFPRHPII